MPEWSQSVEASRQSLGYDVNWSPAERISWIEANCSTIREWTLSELERLDLPETLMTYWQDCLYNAYASRDGTADLNRITRRIGTVDEVTGELALGMKTLPQLPFEQGLVWYKDEDTNAPWLRVEIRIHAGFATKALSQDAAEHAFRTLSDHLRFSDSEPHPVALNVNKAKVESPDWVSRAVEVWNRTHDAHQTLQELYFSDDVQDDLHDGVAVYSNAYEREHAERKFRKRFRDRVMKRLRRHDASVPTPKRGWWKPSSTA